LKIIIKTIKENQQNLSLASAKFCPDLDQTWKKERKKRKKVNK